MSKILEIDVCRNCPHFMTHMISSPWHCNYQDRAVYKPDMEIPDWCQLPNAVEARAELSYRVMRYLEMVNERECSLKAWNAIRDALLELHDDYIHR